MNTEEKKLKKLLTRQDFMETFPGCPDVLERRKKLARAFAETENGIAVLSDYQKEISYIYLGRLGNAIGLEEVAIVESSAFEDKIFHHIPPQELLERHILELRFFQFQKTLPVGERSCYNTVCPLHFQVGGCGQIPVLHRTYYLESFPNGSIWLALCLYTPFMEHPKMSACVIVDTRTGKTLQPETCERLDKQLLSPREIAVLCLLAKGQSSKQIAEALHISVNTVYRHRQNILAALQVSNTAAAVEIALKLRLIA